MAAVHYHCFAVTTPGLEKLCAAELQALGLKTTVVHGGVEFAGGLADLYRANLWSRTAARILVRFGELSARDFPTLYRRLLRLPWGRFVKPGRRCEFRVSCERSRLIHSERIAHTCADALAKALGPAQDESLAALEPQLVSVRMQDDRCRISIDSSGEHLHRRGYRQAVTAAPLRENLAAACLLACGYDGSRPLVDLMCGSGTFAIEAALIATRRAPGRQRDFAFMNWPKYRPGLWQTLLQQADQGQVDSDQPIRGLDNNPKAVAAAEANFADLDLTAAVSFTCRDVRTLEYDAELADGLLICNPPYGERLGKSAALKPLYDDLASLCQQRFSSWQTALLCPDAPLFRRSAFHLKPVLGFSNGGIPVKLFVKQSLA